MSDSPIIRLAAWLYADEETHLPESDPMFKDEIKFFFDQYRAHPTPQWIRDCISKAQKAYNYMKDERG